MRSYRRFFQRFQRSLGLQANLPLCGSKTKCKTRFRSIAKGIGLGQTRLVLNLRNKWAPPQSRHSIATYKSNNKYHQTCLNRGKNFKTSRMKSNRLPTLPQIEPRATYLWETTGVGLERNAITKRQNHPILITRWSETAKLNLILTCFTNRS